MTSLHLMLSVDENNGNIGGTLPFCKSCWIVGEMRYALSEETHVSTNAVD